MCFHIHINSLMMMMLMMHVLYCEIICVCLFKEQVSHAFLFKMSKIK
jgi:hypothetical protein